MPGDGSGACSIMGILLFSPFIPGGSEFCAHALLCVFDLYSYLRMVQWYFCLHGLAFLL